MPAISSVPESGFSSVPKMCKRVLFPTPEGPTIASDSPGARSSETSENRVTFDGDLNVLESFFARKIVMILTSRVAMG